MKTIPILYVNNGGRSTQYFLDEADFAPGLKTVSVSVWSRRPVAAFTWGMATPELAARAKALNDEADSLSQRQAAFEKELEATQPDALAEAQKGGKRRAKRKPLHALPKGLKLNL